MWKGKRVAVPGEVQALTGNASTRDPDREGYSPKRRGVPGSALWDRGSRRAGNGV